MPEPLHFTFVGVPYRSSAGQQRAAQFQKLQSDLGSSGPVLRNVMLPDFRVGTLDSLVEASDDLARLDPNLESTVFRLAALIEEIGQVTRPQATILHLTQPHNQKVSAEFYVKDWDGYGWDTQQYSTKDGIPSLIQKFQQVLSSSEERCRGLLNEYNEGKNKLVSFQRRSQGNYSSVPISEPVKKWCVSQSLEGPVDTEFLQTLFVAVPRTEEDIWLNSYAGFHEHVVPRSSSMVAADQEYALYSLVCFRKAADDVKSKCRQHKFSVREYGSADDMSPQAAKELQAKVEHDRERLVVLLSQQFTQCFVAWMHLKCVRLFVESILKFGVPVRFVPALVPAEHLKEDEIVQSMTKIYEDYIPMSSPQLGGGADDEANQARNAKVASFFGGGNDQLQTDGGFVILKMNNVLKGR